MKRLFAAATVCVAVLVVGAVALTGCKKGESEEPAGRTGSGTAQEAPEQRTGPAQQAGPEEQEEGTAEQTEGQKEEPGKTEPSKTTETEEGETGQAEEGEEGMIKLNVELPEPMFQGTPSSFEVENLDPNTGESRKGIYEPEGTKLVSTDKPLKSSYPNPIIGELSYITDGEKAGHEGTYVTLGPGKQWVQIDLGKKYRIEGVLMWHYHSQARVYKDVIVQLSNDPDFLTGVKTVFNNDHDNSSGLGIGDDYAYVETNEGRWINVEGVEAQYVRCYSKGNTSNEMNHYTEVEVYARPAE